jgi:hypothetical protein
MPEPSFTTSTVPIACPAAMSPARLDAPSPRPRLCYPPLVTAAIEPKSGHLTKCGRMPDDRQNQGGASCPKSPPDAPPDFARAPQPTETAQLNWPQLNKVTSSSLASFASPGGSIPFAAGPRVQPHTQPLPVRLPRHRPSRQPCDASSQTTPRDASQNLEPPSQPKEIEQLKVPSKNTHISGHASRASWHRHSCLCCLFFPSGLSRKRHRHECPCHSRCATI